VSPLCRCGHAVSEHPDEHAEMCMALGCTCVGFWATGNRRQVQPHTPKLRDLIAAGKTSPRVRTQRLALRIEVGIAELIKALRVEREREAVRLHGRRRVANPARRNTAPRGEFPCRRDDCTRVLDTAQGRSLHERRAHDGFNPAAAHAAKSEAA
jgi:hypothetical protein